MSLSSFAYSLFNALIEGKSDAPPGTDSLQLRHAPEEAVFFFKQLGGAAILGNCAVRQNHYLIGGLHGAHAVGNDQYGLSGQQS